MPLHESEAVVLQVTNFGEADRVVGFFSRGFGRLRGVAPNARRSRRRFGASLQPLNYVRLWFHQRERQQLVRLNECELLQVFYEARGDYERSVALNQIAEVTALLLPEAEPNERAFRLLLATLRTLKPSHSFWLPLTYFLLWMVRLSGWLPSMAFCSRCRRPLAEKAYADAASGSVKCPSCRRPGMRLLGAAAQRDLKAMLTQPLDPLQAEPWSRERAAELQSFLLDVIEHHADRKLVTRELLYAQS